MSKQSKKTQTDKKKNSTATSLKTFLSQKPESRTSLKSNEVEQVGKLTAKISASHR